MCLVKIFFIQIKSSSYFLLNGTNLKQFVVKFLRKVRSTEETQNAQFEHLSIAFFKLQKILFFTYFCLELNVFKWCLLHNKN